MNTATIETTTTSNLDFKGLSVWEVQNAIDQYIQSKQASRARWEATARRNREKQATRDRVAKRAKVCNALKRADIHVPNKSDWRSTGVRVSDTCNEDGFFILSFTSSLAPSDYIPRQKAKIQKSLELEVKVEFVESTVGGDVKELWLAKVA